jgi:uncharacterized protein (DUF1800 family)
VRDEPAPEPAWIDALAGMLREDGFRFDRVLRTIFSSRLFYSDEAIGRKIRSPVEMGVGLVRALSATTNTVALAEDLSQLGQALFFPPNVKGWDGGRTWINSQALLGRANMVRRLVSGNASRLPGGSLSGWAQKHEIATAEETVERLLTLLVAVPVPREARAALTELAAAGLRKGPGERDQTLAKVIAAIAVTPEFQLA